MRVVEQRQSTRRRRGAAVVVWSLTSQDSSAGQLLFGRCQVLLEEVSSLTNCQTKIKAIHMVVADNEGVPI